MIIRMLNIARSHVQRHCHQWRVFRRSFASSTDLSGIINPSDNTVRSPLPDCSIPEKNLAGFLLDHCNSYIGQTAMVDGITGQDMSYSQLIDRTSRLSSGLRRMGLQDGEVVSIVSPNFIDYASIFLGTLAAGGVVSTCNPAYSPPELLHQLKDSNAKYLVTTPSLLGCAQDIIKNTNVQKIIVSEDGHSSSSDMLSLQSLFEDSGSEFKMASVDSKNDVAVLPYSSGTTGLPKGVMLTHYNIIANCCQLDHPHTLGVKQHDVVLSLLPFFHIYGMVVILLESLLKGAKQIILPKFEPEMFLSSLEKYRIELGYLVPPLAVFLSKYENLSKYDLSSFNQIMCGAAPLGGEVMQSVSNRLGITKIRQGYGMTEASPVTHIVPTAMAMEKPRSIGPPVPNMICRVRDIQTGELLGPGQEGELVLSGPNIMKGYLNNPAATRECIDANGWYSSGDIGYYDKDGHFFITDRLKELIKVKGFQVAPAELEALLLDHPNILDAAVIGVPDERLGEAPKAFVVRNTSDLQETDVQKYVEKNISEIKWLVGGVEFINEIPKSASGKILRRQLRK